MSPGETSCSAPAPTDCPFTANSVLVKAAPAIVTSAPLPSLSVPPVGASVASASTRPDAVTVLVSRSFWSTEGSPLSKSSVNSSWITVRKTTVPVAAAAPVAPLSPPRRIRSCPSVLPAASIAPETSKVSTVSPLPSLTPSMSEVSTVKNAPPPAAKLPAAVPSRSLTLKVGPKEVSSRWPSLKVSTSSSSSKLKKSESWKSIVYSSVAPAMAGPPPTTLTPSCTARLFASKLAVASMEASAVTGDPVRSRLSSGTQRPSAVASRLRPPMPSVSGSATVASSPLAGSRTGVPPTSSGTVKA